MQELVADCYILAIYLLVSLVPLSGRLGAASALHPHGYCAIIA